MADDFTLGIEEEFQIIDPETRELRCLISQLIESKRPMDSVELQPELHQSVVEVATGICANVEEARRDVIKNRMTAARIADRRGLRIGAASTHPFSKWQEQEISQSDHYMQIIEEFGDTARANLIFGMHVHVGIADRDEAIAIYNMARYFLPHFLALSTSSPFFNGRQTGMSSTRTVIFKRLPRTGIPERYESYAQFERFVATLVQTGCIDDGRRIWWDIRPHPKFSTLEFRICDLPTRVDDVIAIAALIQAVVKKLSTLYRQNLSFAVHRASLMDENKWRAARYGVRGKLIDFGKQQEVPFSELIGELLDLVDDVVDELGSRQEIEHVRTIAKNGTSADRQLECFDKSNGDFKAVVDMILDETMIGVETP